MAQTNYTPISLYYSATASAVPTAANLVPGELAINTNDGKLYYEDSSGVVQVLATKGGVGTSSTTQVLYNSSGLTVGSANLTFDGTNLTTGGSETAARFIPSGSTVATNGMYLPAANTLGFSTNSTERMRITSAGNVGIGTSSPATKLHVAAETPILRIDGTGTANSGAILQLLGWTGASKNWQIDTASTSGANELAFTPSTANAGSTFTTLSQSFKSNGTIGLTVSGSTSGAGITFPATQSASSDANTLDDYEEGTWTPSIGGTATYGTRIATYTKIGDTVRAYFDITIGTIGTGSTTILSGFPFSSNTNNDAGCISYFDTLNATVLWLSIQMNAGTSCTFPGTTAATATIINGIAIFKSGTRVIGTVVYKTTT